MKAIKWKSGGRRTGDGMKHFKHDENADLFTQDSSGTEKKCETHER